MDKEQGKLWDLSAEVQAAQAAISALVISLDWLGTDFGTSAEFYAKPPVPPNGIKNKIKYIQGFIDHKIDMSLKIVIQGDKDIETLRKVKEK